VVDLLAQHHDQGRRFDPTEFIEEGPRVAVAMNVTGPRWDGNAEVFKVFTFREPGDAAVLLQDCTGRDDALAYLAAERTPGEHGR
jgi:hypothetical protein